MFPSSKYLSIYRNFVITSSHLWTVRYRAAFREEFEKQDSDTQDAFDETLRNLIDLPPGMWGRPLVDHLRGKHCEKLLEMRLRSGNVQYRPIYFHGPGAMTITLALWTKKKGNRYYPPDFAKTAKLGRDAVMTGEEQTYEWIIEN